MREVFEDLKGYENSYQISDSGRVFTKRRLIGNQIYYGKELTPQLTSDGYLKITLSNKVSLMKFNATDEECDRLQNQTGAYIQLEIVGKCNINEWMGNITPQIFIEDYDITGEGRYLF